MSAVRKRSFMKDSTHPTAGAVLGYSRVSREDQNLAQQRSALRNAGCTRLFEEKASGGRWDHPNCSVCWTTSEQATWWWSGNSTGCPGR